LFLYGSFVLVFMLHCPDYNSSLETLHIASHEHALTVAFIAATIAAAASGFAQAKLAICEGYL
jgi:hypothetical protein